MSQCIFLDSVPFKQNIFCGLKIHEKRIEVKKEEMPCCKGNFSCMDSGKNQVYVCGGFEKLLKLNQVASKIFSKGVPQFIFANQEMISESVGKQKYQCNILPLNAGSSDFFHWIVASYWHRSEDFLYFDFSSGENFDSETLCQNLFLKLPQNLMQSHFLMNFVTMIHSCYSMNIKLHLNANDFLKKNKRKRQYFSANNVSGLTDQLKANLPKDAWAKLSHMLSSKHHV